MIRLCCTSLEKIKVQVDGRILLMYHSLGMRKQAQNLEQKEVRNEAGLCVDLGGSDYRSADSRRTHFLKEDATASIYMESGVLKSYQSILRRCTVARSEKHFYCKIWATEDDFLQSKFVLRSFYAESLRDIRQRLIFLKAECPYVTDVSTILIRDRKSTTTLRGGTVQANVETMMRAIKTGQLAVAINQLAQLA